MAHVTVVLELARRLAARTSPGGEAYRHAVDELVEAAGRSRAVVLGALGDCQRLYALGDDEAGRAARLLDEAARRIRS